MKLSDLVQLPQPALESVVTEEAYKQKVLKSFIKRGRLVNLPAQEKKRFVILEYLAEEFDPDRRYSEREVNHILLEFNDDVATLRRELIMNHLMDRKDGIYWRI
jgi:hypothetical protein